MRLLYSTLAFALIVGCTSQTSSEKVESSYPDGSPKSISIVDPKTNEVVARQDFYNGRKPYREFTISRGLKNGTARAFYENGKPWSINTYRNDTLNGEYKTFHENGQLFIDGKYERGLRAGVWRFFAQDGNLLKEVSYLGLPDSLRSDR
jgi:antitoxin component YwqK of YwqJK toxin-antitoxin module